MTRKRKKPFSSTNASVKKLEAEGWTVTVVEQRIPHCFITRDAYGFGDILACSPTRGIMLVQVTASTGGGNMAARIRKIRNEPRHGIWLASRGRIQVHCWTTRAKKKDRECRVYEVTSLATVDVSASPYSSSEYLG